MSAWIQELLVSFLLASLKKVLEALIKEKEDARAKAELDEARGVRDSKNVEAYRKAKSREDKIRAAVSLLDRSDN